jgi:D-xylose transport system permease protein
MTTVAAPAPAAQTIGDYARRWWTGVKAGDLGSLPIFVGLIVIAIVFQVQNDRFLTAGNFVNLMVQTAPYAVIAMGVTFALLLGEIDLSIGFVSGVGGVLTALLLTPDGNELPTAVTMVIVLGSGLAIGTLHGLIITKIGVPSFVVTLAGLLAWNGVVLLLIGSRGTVILQNDFVIGLANDFMEPWAAWLLVLACVALYAGVQLVRLRSRRKAGLQADPVLIVALRIAGLAAALAIVTAVANDDRGIPYSAILVGALFVCLTFMLNRTRFGRHIYAVGGNAEAARRAGIRINRVRMAVFMLGSTLAAAGGILLASRLLAVNQQSGGSDLLLFAIAGPVVAGTSLFGGRGFVWSALLGALLIQSIQNGMDLLALSSDIKFMITGGVLLLAVTIDALTRRRRQATA